MIDFILDISKKKAWKKEMVGFENPSVDGSADNFTPMSSKTKKQKILFILKFDCDWTKPIKRIKLFNYQSLVFPSSP